MQLYRAIMAELLVHLSTVVCVQFPAEPEFILVTSTALSQSSIIKMGTSQFSYWELAGMVRWQGREQASSTIFHGLEHVKDHLRSQCQNLTEFSTFNTIHYC